MDRFPRGSSAASAGTAANAAACRLVHPTRPIRPAAGADGPVVGGPTTQKGGRRISFTPRPAPLPFRSGAMTPFPGRAGAAAHPKVKRRPPFSVPAAAPDHDYGAVGREITPARPRRRLRGSATSPVPGHRDAAPLPAAGSPLSAGPNTSVVCATYNLQPTSALWAALVDLRWRRPGVSVRLTWTAQAADGPFKGRGGGGVSVRRPAVSRRAPSLSTGEMARRLRGAVVVRTRAPEDGRRAVTSPPSSSASTTASCWWAARTSPAAPKSATSNSACASTTPPWRTAWRSSCGTSRGLSTSRCTGDGPDPERISWGRPGAPLETTFKGRDFKYERS